jgi:hypothetical protein
MFTSAVLPGRVRGPDHQVDPSDQHVDPAGLLGVRVYGESYFFTVIFFSMLLPPAFEEVTLKVSFTLPASLV